MSRRGVSEGVARAQQKAHQHEQARGSAGSACRVACGRKQRARQRNAHLPPAAEAGRQRIEIRLLEPEARKHIRDTLVRLVAAHGFELRLRRRQLLSRLRQVCSNASQCFLHRLLCGDDVRHAAASLLPHRLRAARHANLLQIRNLQLCGARNAAAVREPQAADCAKKSRLSAAVGTCRHANRWSARVSAARRGAARRRGAQPHPRGRRADPATRAATRP